MKKIFAVFLLFGTSQAFAIEPDYYAIGPTLAYFKYEEPGLITEKGFMYGLRFAMQKQASEQVYFGLEANYYSGTSINYDGGIYDSNTMTSTPVSYNKKQSVLEVIPTFLYPISNVDLYFGLGYRRWIDFEEANQSSDYDRITEYLYVPVGLVFTITDDRAWRIGLEYDLFVQGKNQSKLSQASSTYDDLEFKQTSGGALKADLYYKFAAIGTNWLLDLFYDSWTVDQSNTVQSFVEPDNNTNVFGLNISWLF